MLRAFKKNLSASVRIADFSLKMWPLTIEWPWQSEIGEVASIEAGDQMKEKK